ncbi:MAG: hypothetical protein WA061_01955 [Microgenomates group bacterium]
MLKPKNFNIPTQHPYGMLEGKTRQASEKENILVFLLKDSIEKNPEEFEFIKMKFWHDDLVQEGFLIKGVEENSYKLSERSINLLHPFYKN